MSSGYTPPGGGQSRSIKYANRSAGNLVLNSGAWANVDVTTDMVMSAQAGDIIEVSASFLTSASALTATFFDIVSVVAGAPVNSWGTDSAVGANLEGIQAWRCDSNNAGLNPRIGGSMFRAVTAGDIVNGQVTLRLRYKQPAANNVTLYNDGTRVLQLAAKNHGPAVA